MVKVKKILVLGTTGMLGAMVYSYLKDNPLFAVAGTVRTNNDNVFGNNGFYYFDAEANIAEQLEFIDSAFNPDYIINCIGVINKYCNSNDSKDIAKAIIVNSFFPHKLADYFSHKDVRIIQIATDCVYSGKNGSYNENSIHDATDVYGKTKSLGEVVAKNFLNIRCSIIGPELRNKSSLLEWFLAKESSSTIIGYKHHIWNGVTTLQFAKFCEKIILEESFSELRAMNHTLHFIENEKVTKYQLLQIFNDVFQKEVTLKDVFHKDSRKDMTLTSNYLAQIQKSMRESIIELKNYIDDVNFYRKREV